MNPLKPAYTSFLIRLWRDPPTSLASQAAGSERFDVAHHEWLVQVEHISSGTKEYFSSLEALFAFIQAQLPEPSLAPHEKVDESIVKGQ